MKKTAEHSGNERQSTNSGAMEIPLYLGQLNLELRPIPMDWKNSVSVIFALESARLGKCLENGAKFPYPESMVVTVVFSDPSSCGPLKLLPSIRQVRHQIFAQSWRLETSSHHQPSPLRSLTHLHPLISSLSYPEGIVSPLLHTRLLFFLTAPKTLHPHQS